MLPLYDRILVPEYREVAPVILPAAAEELTTYVGPVMSRERVEQHTRTEARDRLGILGDRLAVYVSGGGGGDPSAEEHLLNVCTALGDDSGLHLVVGAGPLYRGRVLNGDRITWLAHGGVSEMMNGFDLAVCAAGYNTFSELMHAGVPTIFVPQVKLADDQAARAARAVAAGAGVVLENGLVGVAIERAVNALREPAVRLRAAEAARSLVPRNHARNAAAELLRLVASPNDIERAERAINDELLAAARECRLSYHGFVELMRALDVHDGPLEEPDAVELSAQATTLMRFVVERGIPAPTGIRITAALSSKLPLATVGERAAVARTLLPALAAFQDWSAAAAFVRMINTERRMPSEEFASLFGSFLLQLRGRQEDLYRGIAYMSEAMSNGRYPAGLVNPTT
jgi:hypothetical protein